MIAPRVNTLPIAISDLLPLADLPNSVNSVVSVGLSIDSRRIQKGYIFVAVPGVASHGKEYIKSAIQQGAVAVLVQSNDDQYHVDLNESALHIAVPQLSESLSHIAARFYGHPSKSLPTIGFTGTNGKTTCTQLYAQLSALLGESAGVIGTMGYGCCVPVDDKTQKTCLSLVSTGMTTPDPVRTQEICAELLAKKCDSLAMEVSSHGLEQGRITAVDINTAVFTNLTHDHLDYHKDMVSYGKAKAKLFAMPSLGSAVINMDDDFSQELIEILDHSVSLLTFSVSNAEADLYFSDVNVQSSATVCTLNTPKGTYSIVTPLVGLFNLSNLLAVLGVFYVSDKNFNQVVEQISNLISVSGRMESIENTLNKHILVDYAHTPDALENILLSVKSQTQGNVWCVFGCGGDRDKTKRTAMASIAETYADHIIVTSDNPRNESPELIIDDIVRGFSSEKYTAIIDREQAIIFAVEKSLEHDTIVVAGKGHEDYQIIGDKTFPFSDQNVVRLALRRIEDLGEKEKPYD